MPRKGGRRKKKRTHLVDNDNDVGALTSQETLKVPKSLVIRRGRAEAEVIELVTDIRKMMGPYTATNFKEDARNRKVTLAHYVNKLSGPMGISHFLSLTQNASKLNLRVARAPTGPTLSFKVNQFSLTRQVRAVQRRPYDSQQAFAQAPIVVTNNFGDNTAAPHVKLMRITFQNMFPAINVASVKLADCRRVVLFNFMRRDVKEEDESTNDDDNDNNNNSEKEDNKNQELNCPEEEDEEVEVRHYAIRATPVGVNRKVRRLIQAKIPNLSKLEDISDYITGQTSAGAPAAPVATTGNVSDSEPEDETSHVELAQKYSGKGNAKSQKSALKLVELGPRLRLKLMKVERGIVSGDVMYHAYVKKTTKEIKEQRSKIEQTASLKKRRREEQDQNVAKKKAVSDAKLDAKRKRKDEREKEAMGKLREEANMVDNDNDNDNDNDIGESDSDNDMGESDESSHGQDDDQDNSSAE
eukprot:CAMPEP_0197823746 /NCGR_PEP_ID=MMETSP1437-20131217/1058_1 /TAXON_ID=49252 ORGANISM="Eucampia antarctica, Strain CCMP1452" /NCGR_SAMPLE_ID=MMETSP1437 /ASSEMBLY_ACC=CAM_ASM_001096 /LENGTH=468 /DNA_ID=CAMNT_0043423057 /DNA_START=70 /DNA_END=1473 /DNA_ORIENTATION=-